MRDTRTIFEGSIEVDSDTYLQAPDYDLEDSPGFSDDDVPIPDLDVPFTEHTELRFVLDYPFENPLECVASGASGVTLRNVIDAVRDGFRTMYQDTTVEPIANLHNKRVTGAYGEALHVIGDLVIEAIEVDELNGTLEVGIGS